MALITIGLPVYNAELFIRDAIQSILNQTYSDFKLLIVDDGSTDNSIEIINSFIDNRIELLIDKKNLGLPSRLNQIAALTTTKYLARMDSDDIMHPDRIAKQLEILNTNDKIDVLGTNVISINEFNIIQGIRNPIMEHKLTPCTVFIHPTITAKTEWFRKNLYDVKAIRVEDADLWNRTYKTSNFQRDETPLLFYRELGSQYYKKYFKGMPSMFYLIGKEKSMSQIIITVKYLFKGLAYYVFHKLGDEKKLINRRNHEFTEILKFQAILNNAIKKH